jgi:hypothetical protein
MKRNHMITMIESSRKLYILTMFIVLLVSCKTKYEREYEAIEKEEQRISDLVKSFISNPDFSNLNFTAENARLDDYTLHYLYFDSDGQSVRWVVVETSGRLIDDLDGTYTIDRTRNLIKFKFREKYWFLNQEYKYSYSSFFEWIELVGVHGDFEKYLLFTGPKNDKNSTDLNLLSKNLQKRG